MKLLFTVRRFAALPALFLSFFLFSVAKPARATTFFVTSLNDTARGSCSLGNCSLREAIIDANTLAGADTIKFAQGLTGTMNLGSALPNVTSDLTITGPGAATLTIAGATQQTGTIFNFQSGTGNLTGLTLSGGTGGIVGMGTPSDFSGGAIISATTLSVANCVFTGNSVSQYGGAIFSSGALDLADCDFTNNTAVGGGGAVMGFNGSISATRCKFSGNRCVGPGSSGGQLGSSGASVALTDCSFTGSANGPGASNGGAVAVSSSSVTVQGCTFAKNSASSGGGALIAFGDFATIVNSTFSENSASTFGAIACSGNFTLRSCTIAGNSATDASVVSGGGSFTFGNNIFKTGSQGASLLSMTGTTTNEGYNISNDAGSNLLTGSTDIINTDPKLAPLADNGGPTQTCNLMPPSPSIDSGSSAETKDQRGHARPKLKQDDRGAVEFDDFQTSLVVTTLSDENDRTSDPRLGDGTSLREAMDYANQIKGLDTITFAPGLSGIISVITALPQVTDALTIDPAGKPITLTTNTPKPILDVASGASLSVSGLTFTGSSGVTEGGAIRTKGVLIANSCTFSGNSAARGGAVYSSTDFKAGLKTTLINCTFNGNHASISGGAVYNAQGVTMLQNCTLSGNTSPTGGGAAVRGSNDARLEINNTIIAGNAVTDVSLDDGVVQTVKSNGYNLVGTRSQTTMFTATGDQVIGSASPGLAALAVRGGPTKTMALLETSPAIDAGDSTLSVDQRGIPRPLGSADDIGAFEFSESTTPNVTITTPAAGSALNALTVINGTATDNLAVKTVTLLLKRNSDGKFWTGSAWGAATSLDTTLAGPASDRTWSRTSGLPTVANLTTGAYQVTATATDRFNNTSSVAREFNLLVPTKPSVTVTTPSNNSYLKSLTSATGSVNDEAGGPGIAKVEISLKRLSDGKFWNGSAWGTTETQLPTGVSGATWSKSSFPAVGADVTTQMQEGPYLITAKATDKADGVSAVTASSKTQFTIDRTNPATVTVTNPILNAKIKGLNKINGTATDNYVVASVTYTYKRNSDNKFWTGTEWGAETVFPTNLSGPANNRTWSTGVNAKLPSGADLPLGNYGIFVTATDAAGNKITLPRSFNITESIPPTAAITSPANATTVNSFAQVTGTANDLGGSNLQKVAITLRRNSDSKFWNGTEWIATSFDLSTSMTTATQGVTWKCITTLPKNANLVDGSYRLVATATDKAGNVGSSVVSQFTLKRTSMPATRSSGVQLSSASAAGSGTIQLVFTGALNGSAADVVNYGVTLNGEATEIVSVQQKSPGVIVLTTDGLTAGAKITVTYNLRDTVGDSIAGSATISAK